MPYTPQQIDNFGGGLNLRDKADTVAPGQAIDALNVEFTERGSVTQRPGYEAFNGTALTNAPESIATYQTTGGARHLVVGAGTALYAINSSGALITPDGSETGLTTGLWNFARFGNPSGEYILAGNGENPILYWDGSDWKTGVAAATVNGVASQDMPKGACLAVVNSPSTGTGLAPRLAVAGFTGTTGGPDGATSSPSHVYFSDVADPLVWTTTNYIQLTPGDGEKITALVPWRGLLFVFKETKFFVIFGESLDSGGDPVFNYRAVDSTVGTINSRSVVAGRDGVYFANSQGVFRTTGAEPQYVSGPVSPVFEGGASDYWKGGEIVPTYLSNTALGYHDGRLYVGVTTTGNTKNNLTLVYDIEYGWWSAYDFPAACFCSHAPSNAPQLFFGSTATKYVHRHSRSYLSDNGTATVARWRSGWTDLGVGSVKTLREIKTWGSGNCSISISTDYEGGVGTGSGVLNFAGITPTTWGGSTWGGGSWSNPTQIAPALYRRAKRGTVYSISFENSTLNLSFSISRAALHMRATRIPTVITK